MNRNHSPNSHQKIWRTNGLRMGSLLGVVFDIHRVCTSPEDYGCQKWLPTRHLSSSRLFFKFSDVSLGSDFVPFFKKVTCTRQIVATPSWIRDLPGHRLLRRLRHGFPTPRGQYQDSVFPGKALYWQFCSQILKINLFFPIKYIPCTLLYDRTQNAEMLEINGDNWGNSENFGCRHGA